MAQAALDVFVLELRVFENRRVWLELDKRAVGFARGLALFLVLKFALFEGRLDVFAGAMAAHEKFLRERIDRLGAATPFNPTLN
jgi:hypothetical protein